MKKLPFIIGIPAVAIALIVGGAMAWRLGQTSAEITSGDKQMPVYGENAAKPSNPFSALFGGGNAPEPTPTPASSADLQQDLDASTADDGGASDIKSLQQDASGL